MHETSRLAFRNGRLGYDHGDRWLPILRGGDGDTAVADSELITEMEKRQDELTGELEALMSERRTARTASKATRDALTTDEERTAHDEEYRAAEAQYIAAVDQKKAELADFDRQIADERDLLKRKDDAAKRAPVVTVKDDPYIYRQDGHESYFADLALNHSDKLAARFTNRSRQDAQDRLRLHAEQMDKRNKEREEERAARSSRQIHELENELRVSLADAFKRRNENNPWFRTNSDSEKRVSPGTNDGYGGYFTPPDWAIDQAIPYLRAGRVAADLCRHMDIPAGYASINIPKVSTPTLVAPQGANGSPVIAQDITDTAVTTAFKVLAGQEDVDIQWLDLTPGHITTGIVQADLQSAFNLNVDQNVVSGTGNASLNSGGLAGFYPSGNWSATVVTCTQGSPTAANLYGTFGAQASQIAQSRYNLENIHYLWHPRRGLWFATSLDGSSSKPFVESSGFNPFQPGAIEEMEVAEGFLLQFPWGPKVHIDKNVPTTDNGSGVLTGTYDVSIAFKEEDALLFEGPPRVRVFEEVLSGTLQVRFQIYGYVGFLDRYGASITIAQGTGLAAPTVNGGNF